MNIRTFNQTMVFAISLTVSMFAAARPPTEAPVADAPVATPKKPGAEEAIPPKAPPPASAPGETTPPETDPCILGCVTLLGSNNKVSITEIQKGHGVDYDVAVVDSALTLTAFGVTNIANDDYYTGAPNKLWGSEYLSESAWNAGFELTYLADQVLTSALGLFDDLFGLEEDHVAFFYRTNSLAVTKGALDFSSGADGFSLFFATPVSEFAAFNGNTVVSQSSITDVPEPSTLAIFALGCIGLASRRFKKKS